MLRKIFSVVVLCILSASVPAQSNYAVVNGTVVDPQSRPVAGARIELTASSTGVTRSVLSNQHGIFEIAALSPGAYELKAAAPGFASKVQLLQLEVAQKMNLEVALNLESVRQTVEVSASPGALKTTDASLGEGR